MWSVIYLSLKDENLTHTWVEDYQAKYASLDGGVKVVKIADYITGTYGQTIRNIQKAAIMSVISACLILFVVMLLLLRLVIWSEGQLTEEGVGIYVDRYQKGISENFSISLPGMAVESSPESPGQGLAGVLRSMGAYGFRFIIKLITVFAVILR